jgi:cobalt-zinc-cadmium efflux system membrane fusion protein
VTRLHVQGLPLVLLCVFACKTPEAPPAAEATAEPDAVELAAKVVERSGIRWSKLELQHVVRTVRAPAEVELDPDRVARVGPLAESRVARALVTVGDRVERNAALALLSSVAGAESRAALGQAGTDLELARANLRRQEELHASGIDTERTHQEAVAAVRRAEAEIEAARQRAGLTGQLMLRSPIAGTVIERNATSGESVGLDSTLFTIADLSRVWVIGRVYERDVAGIRVGNHARLTLDAHPGREWRAAIEYVSGAVEHDSRALPVRIALDNPDGSLRAGLFGALAIEVGGDDALAVPPQAVQQLGERTVVFVHQKVGADRERFATREVELGRSFDGLREVSAGLQAGDEVVHEGSFTLKSQLLRDTLEAE